MDAVDGLVLRLSRDSVFYARADITSDLEGDSTEEETRAIASQGYHGGAIQCGRTSDRFTVECRPPGLVEVSCNPTIGLYMHSRVHSVAEMSPDDRVANARHVLRLTESLMNLTDPSMHAALTPLE